VPQIAIGKDKSEDHGRMAYRQDSKWQSQQNGYPRTPLTRISRPKKIMAVQVGLIRNVENFQATRVPRSFVTQSFSARKVSSPHRYSC
jgi:hypothetical protein